MLFLKSIYIYIYIHLLQNDLQSVVLQTCRQMQWLQLQNYSVFVKQSMYYNYIILKSINIVYIYTYTYTHMYIYLTYYLKSYSILHDIRFTSLNYFQWQHWETPSDLFFSKFLSGQFIIPNSSFNQIIQFFNVKR